MIGSGVLCYAQVDATAEREGKLKAACLYYITKFVEFPSEKINEGKINLCVLGDDAANAYLLNTFKDKEIKGNKINLIFSERSIMVNLKSCNLVYMGTLTDEQEEEVLNGTKEKPILTISSVEDITSRNGIVHIYKENNKLRIKINAKKADSLSLKISSELLQIAEVAE